MESFSSTTIFNNIRKYSIYFLVFAFIQIAFSSAAFSKGESDKYDKQIKSRNKEISDLASKLKAIEREKNELLNKKDEELKLLKKINNELDITGRIIRKLSDNKQELDRDLDENKRSIEKEQNHYKNLLKQVNIILRNMYITNKEKSMSLLINYKEFHELEHGVVYNKYFYNKGIILLDSLKQLELSLKDRESILSLQVSEIDSIQKNKIKRKQNLNSTINEKKNIVNKLNNSQKALEVEFQDIENEMKAIDMILKALEKQREEELKSGKKRKEIKKEDLVMPVKGTIVRKFGKYRDEKYKVTLDNKGIDIKVTKDKDVTASAEGFVVKAGYYRNLKNFIIIEHSKGVYTFYSRLEHINVLVGDKVKRNSIIGNLNGSKENILHFEVRQGRNPVDPLKHIKK